ncbi:hypothetical protein cyc_05199 [Cyclospora cayetanensis]|uniref:Uncharacterized protein n=1 Tax=Cyclospora cayetanensis TaxID=88456 RepID=A0A1D3CSN5_9EIME|nr:hypothetical protein cyc_05199 [Cyclospora cayetanensis]
MRSFQEVQRAIPPETRGGATPLASPPEQGTHIRLASLVKKDPQRLCLAVEPPAVGSASLSSSFFRGLECLRSASPCFPAVALRLPAQGTFFGLEVG